jgi:SIR2-like domain
MTKDEQATRNLAVLVGNGLSVAFNPDLNLRTITMEMTERIEGATEGGSDVVKAMKEIAQRALPHGATSDGDFETLVGAFGAETQTLAYLRELADLVSPADAKLRKAIRKVSKFAERVRDTGVSHVLQVIFERSHAGEDESEWLQKFVETITSSFDGKIAFGNLNYDTLLLSALIATCQSELADLGHGYKKTSTKIASGIPSRAPSLRVSSHDFPPDRRIQLLHLHGSITYWSNSERTVFAKLDRSFLSAHDQWQAIRERRTDLRPVVVLANQRDKSTHVTEYPFSLAYEMFGRSIARSRHWLIVGYSFRDECVNEVLRAEFAERESKPEVLIVTFGDLPELRTVERALGWGKEDGPSTSWLTVSRGGAKNMVDSEEWMSFVASTTDAL